MKKSDRLFWVLLSRIWTDWAAAFTVVKPETDIRWHRIVEIPLVGGLRHRYARLAA